MDCFISWDGDHIGRQVGLAVLGDDVGEVRRVDQAINSGNELWRSFCLQVGGSVVEIGGDEGRIQIGADHLAEVPDIARRYAELVGATVSVGVGMKMSESAKALLVAKLRGGNQTVLWDPDMQAEIDKATSHPKTEQEKIADEYLGKADQPGIAGTTDKDQHAGFTGAQRGAKGTQGDHEEGAQAEKSIEDAQDAAPPPPEGTHAAEDFEKQLHDMAAAQGKKDDADNQQQASQADQVKRRVAEVLLAVRQQMPVLQQLQTSAPDTFAAIMGLVQGVIELGRSVSPAAPAQPPADREPSHVQAALSTVQKEEMDASPATKVGELDKANLGANVAASGHHLHLPVGSVLDGKVKVAHADGTQGWKEVRAGMVQGKEPGAPLLGAVSHPVSSRQPGAK
jgi:hypothetical protein